MGDDTEGAGVLASSIAILKPTSRQFYWTTPVTVEP